MKIEGPELLISTAPSLGFLLRLQTGETLFSPLSIAAAQALLCTLSSYPGVRGELAPEFEADLRATEAQRATSDEAALAALGVRCDA